MKILVTDADGFIGKNLVESLKAIKDGKDKTRPYLKVDEIYQYTADEPLTVFAEYARTANFVFVFGTEKLACDVCEELKKVQNSPKIAVAFSNHSSAEIAFLKHADYFLAEVFLYRIPQLFGKWNENACSGTVNDLCHAAATNRWVDVSKPDTQLELLYIDDFVTEMLDFLEGKGHISNEKGAFSDIYENGQYGYVPVAHKVALGEIVALLNTFRSQSETLVVPEIPDGSFAKKLYSTYLSYLPKEKAAFDLKMNVDARGSFTELLKTEKCGQVSINISKPGITKGQHWHHTKWEFFIVVAGHGLIQQRKIGSDEILNFEVSGDKIQAVHMLPGYTHNIINLSQTENLVTVMWANERFDPNHPDTFFEPVE